MTCSRVLLSYRRFDGGEVETMHYKKSDFSLQKSSNKVGRKQWIWTFNSFETIQVWSDAIVG